ncbi:MAG: hypothetical protein KatS3mg115_0505 [Candidatus Poribacteria bacterium]|nr:MAG: hypothetical protein KatS3mg115_0505 [Candidatus Poribacteria bacterium]
MQRRWVWLVVIAWAFVAKAQEPPELVVPRLAEGTAAPTIDGELNDPAWASAAWVSLRDAKTGAVPRRPTEVGIFYTLDALYLAYRCTDEVKPNARLTVRDANLWEEEVVELFLDPDGNPRTYYELEWNPLNTLFDAYLINSGKRRWLLRDLSLEGLEHQVAWNDSGWTVEVRLPIEDLGEAPVWPPTPETVWRGNFYRIERSDDPIQPEMTSWSVIGRYDFHETQAFGRIRFATTP